MRKAIILGASSGIGRELAKVLSKEGYTMGLAARRTRLLEELAAELPGPSVVRTIDVASPQSAMKAFEQLLADMGGVDLVVISAGTGHINPDLEWSLERATLEVNVSGFTAMADLAFHHFEKRGHGHLVCLSSVAAFRGSGIGPAYSASKAFVSIYADGLRQKAAKARLPIVVTDVKPGLVDTAMAKGEGLFWVQPPEKVARQIFDLIRHRRARGIVTRRWTLVAWLMRLLPDRLYDRL